MNAKTKRHVNIYKKCVPAESPIVRSKDMKNQGDEHRKRAFIVLYIVWILCDLRYATKEERRRNRMGMTAMVLLPP